jgi:hypothetical protein
LTIELKDPGLAAFLAWLVPGCGHMYQGRWAKGILFSVCVLGTFFYGLFLGEGRVVYASMRTGDWRLPYILQAGVGLPAAPAMIQAIRLDDEQRVDGDVGKNEEPSTWSTFMAPPPLEGRRPFDDRRETLSDLMKRLNYRFELGTVYTMIAGLLNILVIYDAWGGPVIVEPAKRKKEETDEAQASKEAEAQTTA